MIISITFHCFPDKDPRLRSLKIGLDSNIQCEWTDSCHSYLNRVKMVGFMVALVDKFTILIKAVPEQSVAADR